MILSDYSTRKRHDILWAALDRVLQNLKQDEGTYEVAGWLRAQLDFPATEMPMVLTWLKKVAPLVPEASQTGAAVKAYGRFGRRWIWSPRGSGLKPAPVVDTQDW